MKQQEKLEKAYNMCKNIENELFLLRDYFVGGMGISGTLNIICHYVSELAKILSELIAEERE